VAAAVGIEATQTAGPNRIECPRARAQDGLPSTGPDHEPWNPRCGAELSIYDEPKIDCHNHVFDPARFPYAADAYYLPSGQEVGTPAQLTGVFDAYGVRNAVVVGPNSGYGEGQNECLLDVVARSEGRFKGLAVVSNDVGRAELEQFKAANIIGITFNVALLGVEYYQDTADLLSELRDLDLFVDVQVEGNQLVEIAPMLENSGVRMLVDHCGRPVVHAGLNQPGFRTLLRWADTGRVHVKLSGHYKFSREPYPYKDAWLYVHELIDAFGLDGCVWGSDWPFLRASERIDYGPLLRLVEVLLPDPADRRKLLWDTPRRLFAFDA
jgi:predicted TIM-barrel fold metal-dependent hydrolase